MENKPTQPTSGPNSSQSTGTSKTSTSGATPQSGSATPQGQTDRTKASVASATGAAGAQASNNTASTDSATPRTGSPTPSAQDQSRTPSAKDSGGQKEPQSWTNVSSWLDGTNQLPQSVKDMGTKALDQVNKLTTTQKVVGGALLVSGLSWLALRSKSQAKSSSSDSRSNTDYRSGSSPTYRGSRATGATTDQKFQGPYGNSPTRGISDDYPTKSSGDQRTSDSGYRSGSTRPDSASTSGFGDDDYSTDL
ncbi:hypothetical protein [Hymenobacter algoricola]|uniref:Uncharacterized protein n=1 Tax=Hymenobacter algoricola TaxID=486267 RepID=A0ABP7NP89_9BACT